MRALTIVVIIVTILKLIIGTSTWIYIALNGTNLIEIDRLRSNIFIT